MSLVGVLIGSHFATERMEPLMASDLELLDRRAVCSLFGGIHPATLYRHVRTGTIARPVKGRRVIALAS
jgi:hypothetical protein